MKPAEGSTVIGKSVVIRGELSGNEDLYIDGDVEGTVTLPESRLTIGPNARVKADINVRDVIIFGNLTGNVQATGRVDLRQSAIVNGDILAGRLSIEESAVLTGRVELKVTLGSAKVCNSCCRCPRAGRGQRPAFSSTQGLDQKGKRSHAQPFRRWRQYKQFHVEVTLAACLVTPADGRS